MPGGTGRGSEGLRIRGKRRYALKGRIGRRVGLLGTKHQFKESENELGLKEPKTT